MSKKAGTKSINIYHRKSFSGEKNNKRVYCAQCMTRHYLSKYHYCLLKPNLLDLFCCAGGAAYGYYQAGFNVTGIDIKERKNYFCDFIKSDALDYVKQHSHNYHAIHASPPCQKYSRSTAIHRNSGKEYPDLMNETREVLLATGKPFIMENVAQAPIRNDITLRGEMFNLKVIRKRVFEFGNWPYPLPVAPTYIPISIKNGEGIVIQGNASWQHTSSGLHRTLVIPSWRLSTIRQTWSYAMGIDHYMTDREIAESIPPAYTHFLGKHLLNYIKY